MSIDHQTITPVDTESPIPRYFQVESDLRRMLAEGALEPGSILPAETELALLYQVSRQTMRQALSRLVADDLISRTAGRGTFVKVRPDRTRFYLDRSFTQLMADLGKTAHSRVLEITQEKIDETYPLPLQQDLGARCLRLDRLRYGDEEPIGIQHVTILTALCPGIEKHDFSTDSLYHVLYTQYNLAITAIQHTIGATLADEDQALLLQIEARDPLLVVHTTSFLKGEQVIEYSTSFYRADLYEYSTTHKIPS